MKVLVISRNAWNDTNSIGNTLTNFFHDLKDVEFANIYFRSSKPHNSVCKRYYRVTETEIIKKWLSPHKVGKEFFLTNDSVLNGSDYSDREEKKVIRFIHKHGIKLAYKMSDVIWYSRRWMNKNLDRFIESFCPDAVFTFVKSAPQYYLTLRYLKEKYNTPIFAWIADDEYTFLSKAGSAKKIENLRYIIEKSNVVTGCSEEICDHYNSVFGCKAIPLYKGCELPDIKKTKTNNPIQIVYAGNLLYGRLDIVKKVSAAIEKTNCANFEIYSNTLIDAEDVAFFDGTKCSKYMGQRDYEVIRQRLSEADIVLHVESFEESQILRTKYSFSTKIIDCLQSGSVLLAIGPSEISSIKYVNKIPGAYVIDDINSIESKLTSCLNESSTFCERAEKIVKFAQKHHDSKINSNNIFNNFNQIIKGEH